MATQTNEQSQGFGKALQTLSAKVTPALLVNDEERTEALLAAYALVGQLETPWETMLRLSMAQVSAIY